MTEKSHEGRSIEELNAIYMEWSAKEIDDLIKAQDSLHLATRDFKRAGLPDLAESAQSLLWQSIAEEGRRRTRMEPLMDAIEKKLEELNNEKR